MFGESQTMAAGFPKAIMFTIDVLNYRLTLCVSGARARARVLYGAVAALRERFCSHVSNLKYTGFFIFGFGALTILTVFVSNLTAINLTEPNISIVSFPNPFDSRQTATKIFISSDLSRKETPHLRVKIFDFLGYVVKDCGYVENGNGILVWDGCDDSGRKVAKGGYLCVVFTADGRISAVKKIGVLH